MSTPIEDRLAALEAWKAVVDPQLVQANSALAGLLRRTEALEASLQSAGPRLAALEAAYQDAVKRFQKAERMTGRLRVVLRILWMSTASARAGYLSRLPEDERHLAAVDLEEVDETEKIGRREDPDEWRERKSRP